MKLVLASDNKHKLEEFRALFAGSGVELVTKVAIGKPAEKIELVPVHAGYSLKYYREEGTHYVPKIVVHDLIL